ncbi:MAG: insulinase family protein [Blastocatellales bacterium]|nr:insulinase family protein [Blastocatellales bacterium]
MKRNNLVFVALLLIFPMFAVRAQDGPGEFITSNGLKAIHQHVEGNEVIAVRLYFKGGARNITAENAGIETLMLEVAQRGTKNLSKSRIDRELARMGTVIESAGNYDSSIVAMRCVRQHFDRSWELFSDIILNPVFDNKEIELAREQLLNRLRQENDFPESIVASASDRLLYAAHPYINRPFGTITSISNLTAADLKSYHAQYLKTSRMLLVAVGDIARDNLQRKVEGSFGRLPEGNYKPEPLPAFTTTQTPEFQLTDREVATTYIRGTFAAPSLDNPDYAATAIMINILQQLFYLEVRVKRNLSYGADATLLAQGANSGFVYVTTARPNETIRVMFDQMDFLKRQILIDDGVRAIVNGFLTNYYMKLETNDAQAARLAEYELLGGGWRRALTWIDEVRSVKPADIQRVARTYLKNFHFAVVGRPDQFDRALFNSR